MKKIFAIGLAAAFALGMLAGCSGTNNNNNNNNKNNTAPTISGVPETATVMVGEEWNALAGVTASDKEDGDLTSKIEVSARGLTFTDGKTTPTEARESSGYQVRYAVKDSGGLEAEERFCVLYVKQAAAELVKVFEADFSDVTPKYDWAEGNEGEGNNHWWGLTAADGSAATATLTEGRLAIDVTNRNNVGDDKLMLTRGFDDLPVGKYKFAVWAKATPDVKINLNAILDEASLNESITENKWESQNLGGGKYGQEVTSEYKVFALDFEIKEEVLKGEQAKVLFRICLGGNDNANAFKFDVEKITIWKTTGSNTDTDLFSLNSAPSIGGLTIDHTWEGSEATIAYDATEQAVKIDITKYNTEDGVWTIVAKAPLTGATIEAGKKYGIEVEMKANTEITPEIVVGRNGEEDGKDHDPRFIKNDTAVGNSYVKVKGEFDGFATATPYLFFQLGKNNDTNTPAVDANALYIKGIRFFEIAGGVETALFTANIGAESSGPKVEITNQGDGAANVTVESQDGVTMINIGTYNTAGGIWNIVASIPFTGKTIDKTKTYGYAIEMKAITACKAEFSCGVASNRDGEGNDKLYGQDIGTDYKTIYHTFKPSADFAEPGIHILLGKNVTEKLPDVTSNTVYIKSFRFFEVEGNEETSKIQDKFILFGDASPDKTNPKYPISVYNQSDDVFDAAPTGTAYFENNKLVYLIHQGGTDGGHNKLAFGFWDNPIGPLPANAYYVVSFKIKASVALDFNVTLHDMERGWDEAGGGLLIRCMDFDGKQCHADTTEKTIELVSDSYSLVAHEKCELLLEFGKFLGSNKDVKIEISDLKIGYRTVQG